MKKHPNIFISLMFTLLLSILVYWDAYGKEDNKIKAEPEYVAMGDVSVVETVEEKIVKSEAPKLTNPAEKVVESEAPVLTNSAEIENNVNNNVKTEEVVETLNQEIQNSNTEQYSNNIIKEEEDISIQVPEYESITEKEPTTNTIENVSIASVPKQTDVNTQAYNNILGVNPSIQVTEQFNGFSLSNILYKYVPIGDTYYVAENGSAPGNAILQLTVGQPVTIEGVNYTVSKVISNIYYPDAHSVIFSNLSGRAYLQTCERPGEYTELRLVILS